MREISSSVSFEIEPGETVPMRIVHATRLVVDGGPVWVTRSNDVEDYWLCPGRFLLLRRGERLWLSAEGAGKATVRFVAPLRPPARFAAWAGAWLERQGARWLDGWRAV